MEMTRRAALAKGASQYFTGKACPHGHTAPRRASTGECLACRTEGLKAWRSKNPAKVQQHNQQQYVRHADKLMQKSREYRAVNAETLNAKKREYQRNNLHVYAAIRARRDAAKLQRTPAWLTEDDHWMMGQAYELAALRTSMFGFVWHVDHVVPLQGKKVSGLHVPQNMQVIPAKLNRAKSNRFEVAS